MFKDCIGKSKLGLEVMLASAKKAAAALPGLKPGYLIEKQPKQINMGDQS